MGAYLFIPPICKMLRTNILFCPICKMHSHQHVKCTYIKVRVCHRHATHYTNFSHFVPNTSVVAYGTTNGTTISTTGTASKRKHSFEIVHPISLGVQQGHPQNTAAMDYLPLAFVGDVSHSLHIYQIKFVKTSI